MLIAYQNHPQITHTKMYLETMEEILSSLDEFAIIDVDLKNILPVVYL